MKTQFLAFSRGMSVLSAAVILLILGSGCVRDYVMPQAKARLPGHQVESGYSEGLALIRESDSFRRGYMDMDGRIVIPPRFIDAGPFSEGLAAVRDRAGRTGFINPDGTWAVEPLWLEDALPFKGGRALVKLNDRFGYLDSAGRFVIPPRYVRAESFSEGLAATAVPAPQLASPEK